MGFQLKNMKVLDKFKAENNYNCNFQCNSKKVIRVNITCRDLPLRLLKSAPILTLRKCSFYANLLFETVIL